MKLVHIRAEGEPIKPGFNFWPKHDQHSAGFVLRVGRLVLWVRRARKRREWHLRSYVLSLSDW